MFARLFGTSSKARTGRKHRAVQHAIGPVLETIEDRTLFSFSTPTPLAGGTVPSMVKVRDFNNDGKADIIALNGPTSTLSVYMGNGDGTFQSASVNSGAGGTGGKMVVGDFNKDGNLDVVTNQGYSLSVEYGNGDGSFHSGGSYYVGAYAMDVEEGDVNHDGCDDLVTASTSYGGTTQEILNDGHGGFLPTKNLAIGPTGQHIEIGDINNDGNPDLIETGFNTIEILDGNGDGTFRSQPWSSLGSNPSDIQVGDFNKDGMSDLLTTDGANVQISNGNAAGAFDAPTTLGVSGITAMAVGDVNGDGNADIVGNNGLVVLGHGDGNFFAPTVYSSATGSGVTLGDVNNDNILDQVSSGSTGIAVALNANNDLQLLAGATHLGISAPASASAGSAFDVTVTALDDNGNVVTNFQGSVAIYGAAGTNPTYYTFTPADQGVHTIAKAAKLFVAGDQSYKVISTFLPSATGSINVLGAAAAKLTVSSAATATAGDASTVTVSVLDAYGNATNNYTGTVHLSSTDAQAGLPADYTFTADDAGTHTFTVNLKTAGNQTVTVGDIANGSIRGTSAATNVTSAAAVSLGVSGGGGFIGSANAVTITARDAYGNIATGYNGTVHLSTSDAASSTSADAALVNGTGVFTVTPMTLGSQTLSASDIDTGTLIGTETIDVTPGWGARFSATALPSNTTAGQTQSTTLTVYDSFGDVSTVFNGYVAISSTDSLAGVQYVYFSPADAGVKTIPVTLYTAGTQAVTIYDSSNPGVTTTQANIHVAPAAATHLGVSPLTNVVAGTAQDVTVSALDPWGNVAPSYAGSVNFASADSQAVLPAAYTFTAADAGSHVFSVTLKSAGGQDITVSDPSNPLGFYYYQRDIMVSAGSLAGFSFKAASLSNTTAGANNAVTLSAVDAYGNAINGYAGTVHFTSTDAQAGLPANYTFTPADAGAHVFNVVLKTAGSQSVTASDTATGSITGSMTSTVKAAAAGKIAISTATTATAGTAQTVTVTATDAYGNAISNYTGTVKFSSSDAGAVLPANYTFNNKDNGTHTFNVTFKTAGSQSITASDSVNAGMTATQSGISVKASVASVASLAVTGSTSTAAGAAKAFTVTARDANGNVVTGYTGTVTFSSSDQKAGLPASYTFTAADAGSHTFNATLGTVGTQSIGVSDGAAGVSGSQAGITVTPGAAASFVFSSIPSQRAGSGFKFTVTALDAYGNVATGYTGKVTLSSSDAKAGSSTTSFGSGDKGVHTFSYTFSTVGTQTLKLIDTANASLVASVLVSVVAK